MSGRDRAKAEHRRLRKGGRFHADEVFASIPSTYLQAAARMLTVEGFRVFWLAHANWRPAMRDDARGRAVLSYAQVRNPLGPEARHASGPQPGHSSIAAGMRDALASGLIELAAAGTRPRASGGARGQAAEYYVPSREAGARLPAAYAHIPRVEGKVRLHVNHMRALAAKLSGEGLRALAVLISLRHRNRDGALMDTTPISMSAAALADLLRLPRATAAKALKELVEQKHIQPATPGAGRRAAQYSLGRPFLRFARADRDRPPAEALQEPEKPHPD